MLNSNPKNTMKSLGIYLGIINVSIIFITTLFCIRYLNRVKADTESTNMNAFSAAAYTTEQAGFDYMKLQQDAVEGAANYINSKDMSLSEATAFLALNNVNENISVHLIDGSTLSGISTHTDENGSNKVSYESLASVLPDSDCIPEALDRHICITHLYTNPVDGRESIGFLCSTVVDGKNYYLIRVVPGELLHTATEFKEEFSNAELALIDKDGHYIIPSASLTSDNFWDFLRVSNNLSYAQSEELKETMLSNQEVFSLKNSTGEASLFICEPFEGDEDYCFVGYLPSNSLDSPALNLMLLFIVIFGFATLIVCDVSLLVYLNGEILKGMDAAKAANVAKTRFLSSMSHDIRTPMNAIVGMTTIAKKNINNPGRIEECLDKISIASSHMLTLINDILDISKIEAGRINLNPSTFSLKEMIANLSSITREDMLTKNIHFTVNTDALSHEYLYADELRLNQIYLNLLSNAVKYTNPGGTISLDVEQFILENDPECIGVIYRLKDSGIGMSKEFQETMYDSFTRAVDTRIDKIQGTGLGLSITKQMVDLMKGTIECESSPGAGTTFTVTLNLKLAQNAPTHSEASTSNNTSAPSGEDEFEDLKGLHLLVAEDVEFNWEIVQELLEIYGITCDRAENGEICVSMLNQVTEYTYDAVLMDVQMPVMNGKEATRIIRASEKTWVKNIPVIALTADAFSEDIRECLEAGMNGHVSKPIYKDKLFEEMRKAGLSK